MKVLLIDVNCKNSSTGKIVYDLYTAVNKSGNEAAVCYGRGEKIREHNIYKFGIDIETYLHALLTRLTGYTGCFSYFSTMRLIRFIKKFKPDVVHIHELHAYFVNIKPVLKYLREKKIKTIMTLHCEFMYTGKCGHSVECDKWKTECYKCPHLKDYPSCLFFDHTRKMFNQKKRMIEPFDELTIVVPSGWLLTRVQQSFMRKKKSLIIHNGVDTDVFFPKEGVSIREKHAIKTDEKIVLAVAPNLMSKAKGGDYVLRLAENMKDEKVKFILIGVEDTTIVAGENVIILGPIYDKYLLTQYYSIADVFVLCSERETFSMTTAEALCCGTPVAGFFAGAPETIAIPKYSSFVDYGNIIKLKEAILFLIDSEFSRALIADEAKKHYSQREMLEAYMGIYRD